MTSWYIQHLEAHFYFTIINYKVDKILPQKIPKNCSYFI